MLNTQNRVSGGDVAAIMAVLAMSSGVMGGVGEPDNDFFPGDSVVGSPEGAVISSDLEDRGCGYGYGYGGGSGCPGPDTVLGVYDDAGGLALIDDNSSFQGNGFASALYGQQVEPSGLLAYIVTGFSDFDFDGLDDGTDSFHGEVGAWDGWVDWYRPDFSYISTDYLGLFEFFNGDELIASGVLAPAEAIGGFFDIYLNNTPFGCKCFSDLDYYCVSGLEPNTDYEIRVTDAAFDTIIATFDSFGTLLDLNDDDPDAGCCLSVLNGFTDKSGSLYFVVTGYSDFGLSGLHGQTGFYDIAITIPATGCNEADLAEPFGILDLADINAFVTGFTGQDPIVDFNMDGLFDLTDIGTFVAAFVNGCP